MVTYNHFPHFVFKLRVEGIFLNFSQRLSSPLLGALDGYPIELPRIDLNKKLVPHLALLIIVERVFKSDLNYGVLNLFDYALLSKNGYLGTILAESHNSIIRGTVLFLVGSQQRLFDCPVDKLFRNPSLLNELPNCQSHFRGHVLYSQPLGHNLTSLYLSFQIQYS